MRALLNFRIGVPMIIAEFDARATPLMQAAFPRQRSGEQHLANRDMHDCRLLPLFPLRRLLLLLLTPRLVSTSITTTTSTATTTFTDYLLPTAHNLLPTTTYYYLVLLQRQLPTTYYLLPSTYH